MVSVVRGFADPAVNGFVKVQAQRGYTVAGTEDVAGKQIVVVGSAHGEGALGSGLKPTGVRMPIALTNQTQISRTFFTFPGTVLQQGLEFDKTGPYAEKAYDTAIDHMVEIEMNVLFGKRSTTVRDELDASSDEDQTVRTMSGIIEFLELWDAGSTGILVDGVTYAPFAKLGAAATLDTDDRKRIITNAGGVVTVDLWNQWAERVGRYHTNRTSEKLVLCGSGALNAMHKMFRRETCFNVSPNQKAYGLDFTTLNTPYGLYHFTMHPLLNENSLWRNWAFILDIHSMRLRPLRNRDTKLLKNRHNPGDDRRKDEFLTEYMLELHFAENNMLIKNLYDYSAS
ncbi:MAG: hypothetical protein HC840_01185 [Leptolyngbyaceae cyanobacterium RM2_2_4]|nr:hypothetical protein [Leptolyngbyaceae cyanobacterium RM2_2_4]